MNGKSDIEGIGLRIKEKRTAMGLTQGDFAKKLEVTAQAVSKWETGTGYPDIYTLPEIADALNMSVDELLGVAKKKNVSGEPEKDETPLSFFEEDTDKPFEDAEKWIQQTVGANLDTNEDAVSMFKKNTAEDMEAAQKLFSDFMPMPGAAGGDRDGMDADGLFGLSKLMKGFGGISKIFGGAMHDDTADESENHTRSRVETETRNYSGGRISSVDCKLSGFGEIQIYGSEDGKWNAQIDAPEDLFGRIQCIEKNGKLIIDIPAPVQLYLKKRSNSVNVKVNTGFLRGSRLDLEMRGSFDANISTDFDQSKIDVAGAGDVMMDGAGKLDYSVSGSGDMHFKSAHDASIRISGSGDVSGQTIEGQSAAKIFGSGDIMLGSASGKFDFVSNGSGDVTIDDGFLDELNIIMSGSGGFDARRLEVVDLNVRVSGTSDVTIGCVTGRIEKTMSRMSTLNVLKTR